MYILKYYKKTFALSNVLLRYYIGHTQQSFNIKKNRNIFYFNNIAFT